MSALWIERPLQERLPSAEVTTDCQHSHRRPVRRRSFRPPLARSSLAMSWTPVSQPSSKPGSVCPSSSRHPAELRSSTKFEISNPPVRPSSSSLMLLISGHRPSSKAAQFVVPIVARHRRRPPVSSTHIAALPPRSSPISERWPQRTEAGLIRGSVTGRQPHCLPVLYLCYCIALRTPTARRPLWFDRYGRLPFALAGFR